MKSLLTDSAKDCISGLIQTEENYEEVIKLRKLISPRMESLVALSRVKSMSHLNELRSIYDQIDQMVHCVSVPLLIEKLAMIISRKFNVWNLDDLLCYFKQELQAKERCTSSKIKNDDTRRLFFYGSCIYMLDTITQITEITGVILFRYSPFFTFLRLQKLNPVLRFVCLQSQSAHISFFLLVMMLTIYYFL